MLKGLRLRAAGDGHRQALELQRCAGRASAWGPTSQRRPIEQPGRELASANTGARTAHAAHQVDAPCTALPVCARGGVEPFSSVSASTAHQTLPGDDASAFCRVESDHGRWIGRQGHGELGYAQHDSTAAGLVCAFAPPPPNELTVPFEVSMRPLHHPELNLTIPRRSPPTPIPRPISVSRSAKERTVAMLSRWHLLCRWSNPRAVVGGGSPSSLLRPNDRFHGHDRHPASSVRVLWRGHHPRFAAAQSFRARWQR